MTSATPRLVTLSVQIVRWVDDYQPGIVACEFIDANRHLHTVIVKAPIVSIETLNADSEYPRQGGVRCTILDRWRDDRGLELFRITTKLPDGVESTEEESDFVVLDNQLDTSGAG